ncbi:MAG: hypothetical protein ACI9NT_002274 [Bacteroidia bacterium]|jgi:hypothetical protein
MDWRVAFGLTLTTVWVSTGVTYLLGVVGWSNFVYLPTADIGSFLEGAFAPLAFLWLVIGHFMQQKEITANTTAVKLQEKSAARMELHSRRDSYFSLLTLVQDQLGAITSFHYISVCGPTGSAVMKSEEFTDLRTQASTGDNALFVRKMISLAIDNREDPALLQEIFYGTDVRKRHSDNFSRTFSKLLAAAKDVDTDDMLTDALLNGSAQGLLYRVITTVKAGESFGNLIGTNTVDTAAAATQ